MGAIMNRTFYSWREFTDWLKAGRRFSYRAPMDQQGIIVYPWKAGMPRMWRYRFLGKNLVKLYPPQRFHGEVDPFKIDYTDLSRIRYDDGDTQDYRILRSSYVTPSYGCPFCGRSRCSGGCLPAVRKARRAKAKPAPLREACDGCGKRLAKGEGTKDVKTKMLLCDKCEERVKRARARAATGQFGSDPTDIRTALRELREQGWLVEKTTSGHIKCVPPDPKMPIVVTSGTPGDWRAFKNFIARCKRSGARFSSGRDPKRRRKRSGGPDGFGLSIVYSPVNNAYFVMWHRQVLAVKNTRAEATRYVKSLTQKTANDPRRFRKRSRR